MSDKLYGSKRDALIAAGKVGHRVLIFGQKVFGPLTADSLQHENATIDLIKFPEDFSSLSRLADYSLVILDYSAFDAGGAHPREQDIFEKLLEEALSAGTAVCFVHYDEKALNEDYNFHNSVGGETKRHFRIFQIGFRLLEYFSITPYSIPDRILSGNVGRNEFKVFLERWGASHNYFGLSYGGNQFDDVISGLNERMALGFVLKSFKGELFYLPFQRDFSRAQDILEGLRTLIDCLLTYMVRSRAALPEWASEPFFREEDSIRAACRELEQRLEETRALLGPFEQAKAILFQREYTLERTVPAFIQSHLGINTLRDEKHKEDFWILDEQGEKRVIAEVKSALKGFRKSMIYDLYNHRDENGLEESFPALLVANCNLQAGGWKDKDRVIDKQDYQVAAQNNILILRTEDLVRLWESIRDGIRSIEQVYELFVSQKGWLEVRRDLSVKVRN